MTSETRLHSSVTDVAGTIGYGVPAAKDIAPEIPVPEKNAARTKSKIEDLAYGEPVYWLTLIGSLLVIVGGMVAFLTQDNFVSTSYWISSVWQGLTTEEIWDGAGGSPEGHWYLSHLTTGDGLQALGVSVAVFSIVLGMIAAAVVLFRRKNTFFGVFALIAATIVTVAALW